MVPVRPRSRKNTYQRKEEEFNSVVNDILNDGEQDELAILAGVGGEVKLPGIDNRESGNMRNSAEKLEYTMTSFIQR